MDEDILEEIRYYSENPIDFDISWEERMRRDEWLDYAMMCYEMHKKSIPYLPEWEKLPIEAQLQYAEKIERISKGELKTVIESLFND